MSLSTSRKVGRHGLHISLKPQRNFVTVLNRTAEIDIVAMIAAIEYLIKTMFFKPVVHLTYFHATGYQTVQICSIVQLAVYTLGHFFEELIRKFRHNQTRSRSVHSVFQPVLSENRNHAAKITLPYHHIWCVLWFSGSPHPSEVKKTGLIKQINPRGSDH